MAHRRTTATLVGFVAVLLWALLALFTAASGAVPPFQLAAMSFLIGGAIGLVSLIFRPSARGTLNQPLEVWALGIGGLFGYHFFYFTALRNAPPVEAGLIAYLWPLLIVVLSALLPGERLRPQHVVGALMGMAGTALIVTGGGGFAFSPEFLPGYTAAFMCAIIWSVYSVLSRRFSDVPSDAVTGFCLATALLSLLCHILFETTVWPQSTPQWLAVLGLGLGPVGGAFYVWDYGVKHGNIQLLGTMSYAAPLMSTLILVIFGFGSLTPAIVIACIFITGGALLAASG